MEGIRGLVSYKWNVVEVYPDVFFETYLLEDWGHAFGNGKIRDAWGGYCFGMRDHFAILHNGDVALCCVDYDGRTTVGNLTPHPCGKFSLQRSWGGSSRASRGSA